MYKKAATLLAIGLGLPLASHAHVKWFVETEEVLQNETTSYSVTEPAVLIWIGIIIATLIAAFILERKIPEPSIYFRRAIKRNRNIYVWLFQAIVGLGLILASTSGAMFAPVFQVEGTWLTALQITQAIIGALFILNLFVGVGAVLLTALFVIVAVQFGWGEVLEHLYLLGIAFYLIIEKTGDGGALERYEKYGVPILRILTGLTLVILAFHEKLLHPDLGLAFLETHQLNFMQALGMQWFSNELFVLSAGMSEMLLGLILITGCLTRITTLALASFFVATAIVLGMGEVVGHLPIFGVAFILIVYGAGKTLALRRAPKV